MTDEAFSVGVLYDIQEIVTHADRNGRISISSLSQRAAASFRVASVQSVLAVLTTAAWAKASSEGVLELDSTLLNAMRNLTSAPNRLRWQLMSLLRSQCPSWAALIARGRKETLPFVSPNVRQCFAEALLDEADDPETARWWIEAGGFSRLGAGNGDAVTGLVGEMLSIEYEEHRTGVRPQWQSINSARLGYDLASRLERGIAEPLLIEVKATTDRTYATPFHLSRNEWNVATHSKHYALHLWHLFPVPTLRVVDARSMGVHVPEDRGVGKWRDAIFSHKAFERSVVTIGPELTARLQATASTALSQSNGAPS